MKIFGLFIPGADPDELVDAMAKRYEAEMERDVARHELEASSTENGLLRAKITALQEELNELKRGAIQQRMQPKDPFANWPKEIRETIDYAALGLEEPDNL